MREHVARVFDEARRQSKPNIESGIARGRADAEIMNMPLRSETPGTALSEETRRDHEVAAIAKALGFLSSAIKSGEPWSEQCDAMKRAAFSALDSICLRTKEREEADPQVSELPEGKVAEKTYRADVLRAAEENHIWLNAFACINPTDAFLADVGRQVLAMLDEKTYTHVSRCGYLLDLPSQRELIVRINKS